MTVKMRCGVLFVGLLISFPPSASAPFSVVSLVSINFAASACTHEAMNPSCRQNFHVISLPDLSLRPSCTSCECYDRVDFVCIGLISQICTY
jgi:hypothetical protein